MFHWRWINRPKNPLLRIVLAVLAIVFVAGIVVLGFFALLAFAFIGVIVAIVRALTRPHAPANAASRVGDPRVIEGEFVVVRNDPAALKH
ncbi:MAG: hypothetical protein JSS13_09215 [Proteobacteria bacterium]|nr:hypothetical protein [Pseudomonadota bacterium]